MRVSEVTCGEVSFDETSMGLSDGEFGEVHKFYESIFLTFT